MRDARKDDLIALVESLAAGHVVRPNSLRTEALCFYCFAEEGKPHDEGCAWVEARILLDGTDDWRSALVGEEEDELADRLEGEPFEPKEQP